jgi:RNA-directed DNA polymerase
MEERGLSSSEETVTPPATVSVDWTLLPWRKLEKSVYRLQKRIYRASERGNVQVVHRLQQKLMRSEAARLIAVRKVTQDNQGKKTAGVDGVKSLTPTERLEMVEAIHPKHMKRTRAKPVRRVWIPKPGKPEKRPLGIPVMRDRAFQALAKQALEPEWEARFEANSYGFRPGRSGHDAIEAIFRTISLKDKYVLEADIKGCFDNISHQALLDKLDTYPAMRLAVKGWLKAGCLDREVFTETEQGTPQGGVVSPLLANIALHGLEEAVQKAYTDKEGKPTLIRYADDFVVLHSSEEGVNKARQVVEKWLASMGLTLSPKKTRIGQTLKGADPGFDFLGATVRQFPVGKRHSGRNGHGGLLGFKTLIKPSREAIKRHVQVLRMMTREHQNKPQEALIATLNPVITGWANYHRTGVAKEAFAYCDDRLYSMLRRWAQRRHPGKNATWVTSKYGGVNEGEGWIFRVKEGSTLKRHSKVHIKRHVKVRGATSPYDGNLIYWAQRLKEHPLTDSRTGYLLKLQKGKCAYCGLHFMEGDLLETDHIIPKCLGGDDRILNLQLMHRHCHDQKTVQDGSNQVRGGQGINSNDHLIEEPDDEKSSCPVL